MPTQPMEDPMDLRLDTHWSRFVYCDEPVDDEPFVARKGPRRHDDSCDAQSPRGLPEAANGDLATTDAPPSEWLSSYELYRVAFAHRGVVLRTLVLAAVQSAREFARNALAR